MYGIICIIFFFVSFFFLYDYNVLMILNDLIFILINFVFNMMDLMIIVVELGIVINSLNVIDFLGMKYD